MPDPKTIALLCVSIVTIVSMCLTIRIWLEKRAIDRKYAGIEDVGEHRTKLNAEYEAARSVYATLKAQVWLLEESVDDLSFGLYKPHFEFDTPDEYKLKIEEVRAQQKAMVRAREAVKCPVEWTVGNDKREGRKMTLQVLKLALRAFNGECEGAIADVSWNNIVKMQERVRRSALNINELGTVLHVEVTQSYVDLKIRELQLKHEFEEQRYRQREELRAAREQIREEEKARREIEQAQTDAELDEIKFAKMLEKARAEAAEATGRKLELLTEKVSAFEAKLDEARAKKERAMARAQFTKSGFVYVISNMGSFGEDIVKIGMTRRLDPHERVHELGGASVPFPFDTHATLYSNDAPALENALHRHFEKKRLNLVNARREFFRGVTLTEIEQFVKERGISAEFVIDVEAREYRQTLASRQRATEIIEATKAEEFPAKLFVR